MSTNSSLKVKRKIVFIGEHDVGKKSIISTYHYGYLNGEKDFRFSVSPTYGRDYSINGTNMYIQFMSQSGTEIFGNVFRPLVKDCQAIALVYDITKRESFERINHWLVESKRSCNINPQFILVGNKCDLKNKRVISIQEGQELADQLEIPFIEVSAQENININALFETLAILIQKEYLNSPPYVEYKK